MPPLPGFAPTGTGVGWVELLRYPSSLPMRPMGFATAQPILLRQQREGAVPVFRRRVFPVSLNSRLIQIIEIFERVRVVGLAAALDRGQRALPVAAAIARQHLDGEVTQALEAAGLCDILAAGDGIDHLGLLLALDHDEIELEDRKLVLDRERGLGADDDRESILLGLPLQARRQVDAVAQHRIVETQVGTHIADHASAGIQADADIERNVGMAALPRLLLAYLVEHVDPVEHVDRGFAGVELMLP